MLSKLPLDLADLNDGGNLSAARRLKDPSNDVHPILAARLRQIIAQRHTNAMQVSIGAGKHKATVADILSGKNKNPSITMIAALAKVLKVNIAYLLGESDIATPPATIPVRGVVEDAMHLVRESSHSIIAQASPDYPEAIHFALDVRDDATNATFPALSRGAYALCVELHSAGLVIESGRLYALVRRASERRACLIREAKVFTDRIEFRPVSTVDNSEPITLRVPVPTDPDGNDAIFVWGLVYGQLGLFHRQRF